MTSSFAAPEDGDYALQRSGDEIDGAPKPERTLVRADLEHRGRHAIVSLLGEIDLSNAHAVCDAVSHCLTGQPDTLSLNISALTFCDASGLRALRRAMQQAESDNVEFRIIGPDPWIRRLFTLVEADDLLAVVRDPVHPAPTPHRRRSGNDAAHCRDRARAG